MELAVPRTEFHDIEHYVLRFSCHQSLFLQQGFNVIARLDSGTAFGASLYTISRHQRSLDV
jgi:hypothetical protein